MSVGSSSAASPSEKSLSGKPLHWKTVVCSHDCPDSCSVRVGIRDDRLEAVQGDPAHPLTAGFLCGKVNRYRERVYSAARVHTPMRRTGPKGSGQFEPISWDAALDLLCTRLQTSRERYGAESILPYSYGGNIGRFGMYGGHALFYRLGASRLERTICTGTASAGLRLTHGNILATPLEEVERARLIIVWGMNVVATHVHMMPLIKKARAAGAKLVVIDAYRNATARQADQFVRVRPGSDGALALAMMHVILRENLHDPDFIARRCVGLAELQATVRTCTPSWAETICGVPAADIEALARAYGQEKRSFIRLGIGISRHGNGGMTVRTISCLPALVGHWGQPGAGLLCISPSDHWLDPQTTANMTLPLPEDANARTVNMIRLGEALTTLNDPPIKTMYVYGSNPAVIAPEQGLVLEGLRREDLFLAVHEQMFTDTTDYADLVLPATTFVEHDDVLLSYGTEYAQFSRAAMSPVGEARPNLWVFRQIAERLGLPLGFYAKTSAELAAAVLDRERLLAAGFDWEGYLNGKPSRLPPIPPLNDATPLDTDSGKIELFSAFLAARGQEGTPCFTHAAEGPLAAAEVHERYPLQLMTPPTQHFLNSSFGSAESSVRLQKQPRVMLNPADARTRQLADGQTVRVFNDRGESFLALEITEDVAEGVSVAEGLWWSKQMRERKANHHPGEPHRDERHLGINHLISAELTDFGRGARFNECRVQIEAT